MSKDIISPEQKGINSFEEFKQSILQQVGEKGLLEKAANLHGRIPNIIRVLHNFDPIGIFSAVDQLASEEKAEQDQENILRAIYNLSLKLLEFERHQRVNLTEEKFRFLFYVYIQSKTDKFARVEVDFVQEYLGVSQHRIISIGQYLDKNNLIIFNSWVEGIKIAHKGIIRVESDLIRNNYLPSFVSEDEVNKIEDRFILRYKILKVLFELTGGDTLIKVPHSDLAEKVGVDHDLVLKQALPYLSNEDLIKSRTADTVAITEEGIDRFNTILH